VSAVGGSALQNTGDRAGRQVFHWTPGRAENGRQASLPFVVNDFSMESRVTGARRTSAVVVNLQIACSGPTGIRQDSEPRGNTTGFLQQAGPRRESGRLPRRGFPYKIRPHKINEAFGEFREESSIFSRSARPETQSLGKGRSTIRSPVADPRRD